MPRKKINEVWENYIHTATTKAVKCKYCEKVYKFGNVSKMTCHLIKCFKCPSDIKNKLKKNTKYNAAVLNTPPQKASLPETLQDNLVKIKEEVLSSSSDISIEKKRYLDHLLSKATFVTGTPLSIVEPPPWVQYLNETQPFYEFPERQAISTTNMEAIYQTNKNNTEELESTYILHLQCDGWNNQGNDGIINVTVLRAEPFFVKRLNTFKHQKTSQYLTQEIFKVINMYGGHNFLTIIGDNTINIQRALHMVKDIHTHIIPLTCIAHTLNLLCEDCLKVGPNKDFMPIALYTINAVKQNDVLCTLLEKLEKDKESDNILKLPVKTQWSSYFTALKSLQSSKEALQTLAVHQDTISNEVKSYLLDVSFWTKTENCIKLLKPIAEKIIKFQNNEIQINEVYMILKDIKFTLHYVLPDILNLDDNHKQEILNAVHTRISNCIKPIHCAAYMLDPRTQGLELEQEHEVDAMECIHDVGQLLNIDVTPDLACYRAKEGLWSKPFIWKNVVEINPVVWWKGLCSSKLLSRVAVRLLTTPCSLVSETSFTTHKHANNHKRSALTIDREAKTSLMSYHNNNLHGHNNKADIVQEPSDSPTESSLIIYPIKTEKSLTD